MLLTLAPTRSFAARTPRASLFARLLRAHDVWTQRRRLADLDAGRLADMGIAPAAARTEATRPFWELAGTRTA